MAGSAGATTIDFEANPPADGAAITDQYNDVDNNVNGDAVDYGGVTFDSGAEPFTGQPTQTPTILSVGSAHSGSRVISFTGANPEGEPGVPSGLWATFDYPRASVSIWLYQATTATTQDAFSLTGYDESGSQVAQDRETVSSGGGWVQLSISVPVSDSGSYIRDFTLEGGSGSTGDTYYADDLSFSDPAPGAPAPTPSFNVSSSSSTASVQQGSSTTVTLDLRRFGHSSGQIGFTASGLPSGVSYTFTPSSAGPADRQVTLTLSADNDTATTSSPVSFTVTPQPDSSSGTGNAVSLGLTVTASCVSPPQFSVVHFTPLDGCFHAAGRSSPGTLQYTGHQVKLNGMLIDVTGLAVIPSSHHISALNFIVDRSNMPAAAGLAAPLYAGPIDVNVPDPASADDGVPFLAISTDMLEQLTAPFTASPPSSDNSAADSSSSSDSGGSGSGSGDDDKPKPGEISSEINLTSEGAEAPIGITLPSTLGGLSAEATLKWKTATGYDPDAGFKFALDQVPLGPLTLGPLSLEHTGADDWEGTAGLKLPDPIGVGLQGTLGFGSIGSYHGLKKLAVHVEGLNLPFVFGSTLDSIDIGFGFNQQSFEFTGGMGVQWGPKINNKSAVEVDGSVDMKLGYSDLTSSVTGQPYYPFDIAVHADVKLVDIQVGSGDLEVAQDDQGPTFRLAAQLGIGLPYHRGQDPQEADMFLGGHILFWVQPPNFDGEAGLELKVLGVNIASADALISNVGFGVCGHIGPFTGGAGERWGESLNIMGPFGCDISDYRPLYRGPNVSAAQASRRLRYPARSKPVYLKLYGIGGTPKVILSGPAGRRLTMPLSGHAPILTGGFLVMQQPSADLTIIGIAHPGGRWKLTPEPGSPVIRQALGATTLPSPKVTARIVGHGRSRTIVYRARALPQESITFAEIGPRTHRVIAVTRALSGRIRFTPGYGPAGQRTVVAIVYEGGIPQRQFAVAAYRAPKPTTPVDPSGVRVSRGADGTVTVSWRPGTQVDSYRVMMILSDGTHLFRVAPASGRSVSFAGIPASVHISATVQAERTNGGLGALVAPGSSRTGQPPSGCRRTRHSHRRCGRR
jgi:hypothetical protein